MTRPFGLRDLGLLWGLRGQGLTLDMQRAALWGPWPLQAALAELLPVHVVGSTLTFVRQSQAAQERGIVQVLTCPERQEWQVIHLAPWSESQDPAAGWIGMLGDLCPLAGRRGALRIRAGVVAGGPEEGAFLQAGFATYAREEVYRLPNPQPLSGAGGGLRPIAAEDAWPLLQLVGQVVPPPVQHAEGMTVSGAGMPVFNRLGVTRERGFVLERGAGLGAYVGLGRSGRGTWARILLHPESRRRAGEVVRQAVDVASPGQPLYCAVREYQAGLRGLLAAMGFELVAVQAWLVKHTTRPAECLQYRHLLAPDMRTEPITTPLHPVSHMVPGCSRMAREHWKYDCWRTSTYAIGSN